MMIPLMIVEEMVTITMTAIVCMTVIGIVTKWW